jgi:hypothetical protein
MQGYLDVSRLHTFKIKIFLASSSNNLGHRNFSYDTTKDFFVRRAFQDLAGYPQILDIIDLRPLRGRHAYKASMRSALPDSLQLCQGDLGVSTLRSIKTMTQFSSFFGHQTCHAAYFNARVLLYECAFDALLFSSSYRPVGKPVSHHVVTRLTSFSSSSYFLYHHTGHPARHGARILLYECIFDAL